MDAGAVGSLSKDALVELLQTGNAPPAEAPATDRPSEGEVSGAADATGADRQAASGSSGQATQSQRAAAGAAAEPPRLENLAAQSDGRSERGPGPQAATLGPMAEVVHNSLSYLTHDDLDAIATYLKDLPSGPSRVGTGPDDDRQGRLTETVYHLGKTLYQGWCAACHRPHGQGEAPYVPALADDPVLDEAAPNNVVMSILQGAPAEASQAYSPFVRMPGFADELSDTDVAALASYLRARWGDTDAPKVPVSLAAKLRAQLDGQAAR